MNKQFTWNSLNLTHWRGHVTSTIQEILAPEVVPGAIGHHLNAILAVLVVMAVVRLVRRPVGELGLHPIAVPHPPTLVNQVVQPLPGGGDP